VAKTDGPELGLAQGLGGSLDQPAGRQADGDGRMPVGRLGSFAAASAVWLASGLLGARGAPERKAATDTVTPALERRLTTGATLDDVVVDIRWPFESKHVACHVFGNGVGLWDRQVQFRLAPPEAESLFRSVARAGFGSLPGTIGGEPNGKKRQTGRVTLTVGPVAKTVVQLEGGEQSPRLQGLAEAFLRASAAAAAQGVRVSSFDEGFTMLAAGTLAPEALQIDVLRPAQPSPDGPPEGWRLRLDGRRATVRTLTAAEARRTGRTLLLSKADFQALLDALRQSHPETWPPTFSAAQPTDIRIQLLDKVRAMKASPPSGPGRPSAGAKQKAFDRVFAALLAIHERLEKDGKTGG